MDSNRNEPPPENNKEGPLEESPSTTAAKEDYKVATFEHTADQIVPSERTFEKSDQNYCLTQEKSLKKLCADTCPTRNEATASNYSCSGQ